MTIQPIVEGHGEVAAVPVLLRRLCEKAGAYHVGIGRPIRRRRWELVQEEPLRRAVCLARLRRECSAVLVLFDSDDDCPKELAPALEAWTRAASGSTPSAVVMAHREYEAWFLASLESLRGCRGIAADATSLPEPESPRGAKERLERCMVAGRSYSATADQPALTARFDMRRAYARCRSFRRLVAALGSLLRATGVDVGQWPPACWAGSDR